MKSASKIQNVIHDVKKLKKDGSIPSACIDNIVRSLKCGKLIIMPIDSIYGFVGLSRPDIIDEIISISGEQSDKIEVIISSFKMLEEMAYVDRFTFNFLRRVWPGEVTVQLKKKACMSDSYIFMRMPRHKYIQDILKGVGMPIVYLPVRSSSRKILYNEKTIKKNFTDVCSMLIISEFNKDHTQPTTIDVSCEKLNIINEGRVSSEEIKSLYFLGNI